MADYGCMLRAYRRHIVSAMLHCHERSTFIPILANTFARKTIEIDVMHAEREFGTSKYSFLKLINLMYDLLTCLTTTPLRILSLIGSVVALSGFLLALLLIGLRLFLGAEWAAEGCSRCLPCCSCLSARSSSGWGYWGSTLVVSIPMCGPATLFCAKTVSAATPLTTSLRDEEE